MSCRPKTERFKRAAEMEINGMTLQRASKGFFAQFIVPGSMQLKLRGTILCGTPDIVS